MKRLLITALCIFSLLLPAGCASGGDVHADSENLTSAHPQTPTPEISAPDTPASPTPLPSGDAHTVKALLAAAAEPCGRCLYVWGGGWNEEDTGAGPDAMTMGASPRWYEFFREKGASYDYRETFYQIHDGLDCTGYLGYCVYQVFGSEYSQSGYVFPSGAVAEHYREFFGGEIISRQDINGYQAGDVMCTKGHAYLVVGQCSDGSVLFFHASPPAVSLCGTPAANGSSDSEAVALAEEYMSKYRGECFEWFDTCQRGSAFLTDYDQYRWDESVLSDPNGYRNLTPREILDDLFEA